MKYYSLSTALLLGGFLLTSSRGKPEPPLWEKENVSFPMMNQEIRHSMQENERQKEMKKKQNTNLLAESFNKNQWTKFKETTSKIQDRLRIVDFAMQSIPTGIVISQEAKRIKDNQIKIYEEIRDAPYSLLVGLPKQIQFADDLQMVVRLLAGIVASYGAINQMEKAERKILLDFALQEVEQLYFQSDYILATIRNFKEKIRWNKAMINNYINSDREIVKTILNNIKTF